MFRALSAIALMLFVAACGPASTAEYDPHVVEAAGTPQRFEKPGLSWTSVISPFSLDEQPDPLVVDTCIHNIVSSRHVARADDKKCSACHYAGGEDPYQPDIAQGSDDEILPETLVNGRTWSGPGGWAERFVALDDDAHATKPAYLRAVFAKWLDDGERTRDGVTWSGEINLNTFGKAPNENVNGAKLVDAINNRVSPRPDARLCSECHYPGSEAAYRPDNDRDLAHDIEPETVVDGRTWAGPGGWAERFLVHDGSSATEKPLYLRELFATWLEDGGR